MRILTIEELIRQYAPGFILPENEKQHREPIYVITNEAQYLGASLITLPEVQIKLADLIQGNYFVLPSSIHEVLVVKENGSYFRDGLLDIVRSVNEEQVRPEEVLSYAILYYDRRSQSLTVLE